MANYDIFYIADMHFRDKGTFKWDIRNDPHVEVFASVEEKDEAMIDRWNARVSNRDHVYILGDVFSCNQEEAKKILKRLHGAKHFVRGNHDKAWLSELAESGKSNVLECVDYKKILDDGRRVVLSHYPIAFWDDQHAGAHHVYGHVHNSREYDEFRRFGGCLVSSKQIPEFRAYNCGAMIQGYEPKTLDELIFASGIGTMPKEMFREKDHALSEWRKNVLGDKNPNAVFPDDK